MPLRVFADAAIATRKYLAIFPVQKQPFLLTPVVFDDPPSSSPSSSEVSSSTPSVSNFPPLSLYLLATASLFLSSKAHDSTRKLNEFVDVHIAIVSTLQKIRKLKERELAKLKKQSQAIERVKLVWSEFHTHSNAAVEQHIARTKDPYGFVPTPPSAVAFNPLTLDFPSVASTFAPSNDWTTVRATIVYIEFILLTYVTEFAFNNVLTSLENEGIEGTIFTHVQQLVLEMIEPPPSNDSSSSSLSPTSPSSPYPSAGVATHFSRLAWILTHAAVKSTALLHSNAHIVAIAITFLTAQRFAKQQHSTNTLNSTSTGSDTPIESSPGDVPMDVDSSHSSPSTTHSPSESIDLNLIAQSKGWIPTFAVTDRPASAHWYHALCPTLTPSILLTLCELIMESALAQPLPPQSDLEGLQSDNMPSDIDHIASQHPWFIDILDASFPWNPAPTIIPSDLNEELVSYTEPYPRIVHERPVGYEPEVIAPPEYHYSERREKKANKVEQNQKNDTLTQPQPPQPPQPVQPPAVAEPTNPPINPQPLPLPPRSDSHLPSRDQSHLPSSKSFRDRSRDRSRSRDYYERDRDRDHDRDRYRDRDRDRDRHRDRERDRERDRDKDRERERHRDERYQRSSSRDRARDWEDRRARQSDSVALKPPTAPVPQAVTPSKSNTTAVPPSAHNAPTDSFAQPTQSQSKPSHSRRSKWGAPVAPPQADQSSKTSLPVPSQSVAPSSASTSASGSSNLPAPKSLPFLPTTVVRPQPFQSRMSISSIHEPAWKKDTNANSSAAVNQTSTATASQHGEHSTPADAVNGSEQRAGSLNVPASSSAPPTHTVHKDIPHRDARPFSPPRSVHHGRDYDRSRSPPRDHMEDDRRTHGYDERIRRERERDREYDQRRRYSPPRSDHYRRSSPDRRTGPHRENGRDHRTKRSRTRSRSPRSGRYAGNRANGHEHEMRDHRHNSRIRIKHQ